MPGGVLVSLPVCSCGRRLVAGYHAPDLVAVVAAKRHGFLVGVGPRQTLRPAYGLQLELRHLGDFLLERCDPARQPGSRLRLRIRRDVTIDDDSSYGGRNKGSCGETLAVPHI